MSRGLRVLAQPLGLARAQASVSPSVKCDHGLPQPTPIVAVMREDACKAFAGQRDSTSHSYY